jgi:hypothetical protein
MTPFHELRQLQVAPAQRYLKNHLLTAIEASRLPHLREPQVSARRVDGRLEFVLRHAAKPDVVLQVVVDEDGSGWIDCEALEPEFHIDFDRYDQAFAVEAVMLILHGWASVRAERPIDGEAYTTVLIETPQGDHLWEEAYKSRHGSEGARTVTWTSTRDARLPPPLARP